MTKQTTKRIRVLVSLGVGLEKGTERDIPVDSEGIPLEQFWRQRLKDAKTDNCVEWVKADKPKNTRSASRSIGS